MNLHDYFMTGSVVGLIIFEILIVASFLKKNLFFRLKVLKFFHNIWKKAPKSSSNKKVSISIVNEQTHDEFKFSEISDKFSLKMKQMDAGTEAGLDSHIKSDSRSNSVMIGNSESTNKPLLSPV